MATVYRTPRKKRSGLILRPKNKGRFRRFGPKPNETTPFDRRIGPRRNKTNRRTKFEFAPHEHDPTGNLIDFLLNPTQAQQNPLPRDRLKKREKNSAVGFGYSTSADARLIGTRTGSHRRKNLGRRTTDRFK